MTEQITTKPFVSRRQQRFAFATGQPWAKRWAHETSFSGLPEKKDVAPVATAGAARGPGGLMSAPGMGSVRRKRKRIARKSYTLNDLERVALKEADPVRAAVIAAQLDQATLKGESLAPGVTRIHGDLCNVHGRWGSCAAAGYGSAIPSKRVAPKQLPKTPAKRGGGRKGGAKGTGRRSDAQRLQEQLAREARAEERYQKHRAEREADRAKREAERQKKGGKGGGKGSKRQGLNLPQALLDAASKLSSGQELNADDADGLIRNGLARRGRDGTLVLTARGLLAAGQGKTKAMETTTKAGSPSDYLVVEDPKLSSKWHLQVKKNGTPDHRLMGAAWAALHGGYRGNEYTGPNKSEALSKLRALYASEKMPLPSEKSFTVFKDAANNWRWIARTTTAYRDREGEIISVKALEEDAARMTATGQYGPLRYWHVGQPDPTNVEAPWGPGLDIGDCDFSIVIGRTSIESGTFKSAEIGQAFAESADEHELSPGFFHAIREPDASGVFNAIRRFERSPVPTKYGRASNLFTGLTVKEHRMDQATYEKRVKAYLDFTREKGVPPEVAAAPLQAMEQADKDADERQIAYKAFDWFKALVSGEQPEVATKEEPAPATEQLPDPLVTLKAELEALRAEVATLKAPPPPPGGMDAEDDPAQGGDAGADEAAEGESPIDEGGDGGLTLSTDDLAAIGQVIGSVLQSALDGHMGELKALMGGFVRQKDDSEAAHTTEIAALKASIEEQQAKLAELLGDQPRGGYRPTQTADNTPWTDPQVLAAVKGATQNGNGFEDLTSKLFPGMLGN